MRRIGNSKKLKVIIPWLLSGMSFCPDSHWWRTRRMLLCFCLREIEATGLRAAGRWGINSRSLFPSAMQLSCAVRTGSYDKVLASLLHPYPPYTLCITAVMTDTSISSFAILPSSLPCRLTSAASWVANKMKNYWRHNYTTFRMCLRSHPCSDLAPSSPRAMQGGPWRFAHPKDSQTTWKELMIFLYNKLRHGPKNRT